MSMSAMDLLLGSGDDIFERPEEELDVSRLSKKYDQPFTIKIKTLTLREFNDVPNGADRAAHIVLKGVISPDFSNEELRRKRTPKGRNTPLTPIELINEVLLPGEIINVYNAINELSGFGEDAIAKLEKK